MCEVSSVFGILVFHKSESDTLPVKWDLMLGIREASWNHRRHKRLSSSFEAASSPSSRFGMCVPQAGIATTDCPERPRMRTSLSAVAIPSQVAGAFDPWKPPVCPML